MIVMLDTSSDLDEAALELGCAVEELLTPLTARRRKRLDAHWCCDNGAFAKFDPDAFIRLLERNETGRSLCRWVAVPDVVGSAIRTLEVFQGWKRRLASWPLAYVAQDGQELHPIPWDDIQALFIGGSTEWKLGPHASACVKAGKALGKWVHVGRINTPGRFEYFDQLGADSCDGSGLARYSHMRKAIYDSARQPKLFT
jgi:hypothetical protein